MDMELRLGPAVLLKYIVASAIILAAILTLFTDYQVSNWKDLIFVVLMIQAFQILMQPLFNIIARLFGMFGVMAVGLFGFAIIFWLALEAAPGISGVTFRNSLPIAWLYAAIIVIVQWAFLAKSDQYLLRRVVKKYKKGGKKSSDYGFIFVQLDGVSSELLEWQLIAGNLPNIRKLINESGYKLKRWETQLPSTTPASQAGILFGNNDNIPAFRWFDRNQNTLVVANQPQGAAAIEKASSNGKGLLADKGVSLGNLFSGDAAENIMVMSKLGDSGKSLQSLHEYTDYFSNLYGFIRAIVLSIGEMLKEYRQARHQKKLNIEPRVDRELSYVVLRAATNVLLRDLQTRIVMQKMMSGVNCLYVDYLDYDEIAHHAGMARPESLDALAGLDRVLGILTQTTKYTPRPYHVIIVSDHGQSQGPTYKQLNGGVGLEQLLGQVLASDKISAETDAVESKNSAREIPIGNRQVEPQSKSIPAKDSLAIVTGSGNVGNIWFRQEKSRLNEEEINTKFPDLISKILSSSGVGFVVVNSTKDGPVCVGKNGRLILNSGAVHGKNPLTKYTGDWEKDIKRVALMNVAPDIQVVSDFNLQTNEVYAFEELVGSHGGLGGWQTNAMLLHPGELKVEKYLTNGVIRDSVTIHKIFVDWMENAGQRTDI
jgi:hypothetical protein